MANQLIIPNDYCLFTIRWERDSVVGKQQSCHVGAHLGTDLSLSEALDQFTDAWEATGSLVEAQPTPVTATNLNLRARLGDVLYSVDRPFPWAAGGGSPDLMSPAVSYCIKEHTVAAGRRFRGRFQLPWAVESEVDEAGVIDGTVVGSYTVAAEVFRAKLADDATKLRGAVILHSINGLTPTTVTGMQLRTTVGTVRKRQRVGS